VSAQPRILYVVELSTAHLPYEVCENLSSYDGVTAYPLIADRVGHGWLLWVPDAPEQHAVGYAGQIPGEVLAIQRYARLVGCGYVLLDRDAAIIADLPSWDW
jgi:hypothetical protein